MEVWISPERAKATACGEATGIRIYYYKALKGRHHFKINKKNMSQSLSKIYVHIIFSVKNREPLIQDTIKEELFNYLGGICKNLECNPIQVGGYRDHVHILCILSKKVTLVKLLEDIKSSSSKWIKTKGEMFSNFYWQSGYGAFSVNPTEIEVVKNYIINQQDHHKTKSFQDEYRAFLKKYDVQYNEEYVWD
ncbi:IS200/IS605 family transposase [Chryseobacterium luquanense]|uniref:IS200/IS605 family transposase n=1 Tax=Chryseobacterium luquanense TaxID=2983766 RepID=A0ABT3Y1U0_9FLAO|nr:IS200/IS605 family transposase [Chryseobacterium luquanense]MCX8532041.1 IS200/IS605 family transposase [Chryseobacterium luquanense]